MTHFCHRPATEQVFITKANNGLASFIDIAIVNLMTSTEARNNLTAIKAHCASALATATRIKGGK